MSTPEPESVQRLPSTMVLPERRGPPTSSGIHPGGVRGAVASQTAGTCAGPDVESEFGWTLVVGAAVLGMPDFLVSTTRPLVSWGREVQRASPPQRPERRRPPSICSAFSQAAPL